MIKEIKIGQTLYDDGTPIKVTHKNGGKIKVLYPSGAKFYYSQYDLECEVITIQ